MSNNLRNEQFLMQQILIIMCSGGSYRRGAATSGDIDCLITKSGTSSTGELLPFLSRLVTKLTDSGFLVAALAVPGHRREDSASKWHGGKTIIPNNYNSTITDPIFP